MIGNGGIFKSSSGFRFTPRTAWVRCTGAQLFRANCRCLQCRSSFLCQVPPPPFFKGLIGRIEREHERKSPVGKNWRGFRLHPARRLSERLPANDQHFPHHRQFRTSATAGSLHRPRRTRIRMTEMFGWFRYPGLSVDGGVRSPQVAPSNVETPEPPCEQARPKREQAPAVQNSSQTRRSVVLELWYFDARLGFVGLILLRMTRSDVVTWARIMAILRRGQ
jgi:hypothetical protein